MYWCFVDVEKEFNSMNRATLLYKVQNKDVCEKFFEHIKRKYEEMQFWVTWIYEEVTEN